jgi:hypothetical protein
MKDKIGISIVQLLAGAFALAVAVSGGTFALTSLAYSSEIAALNDQIKGLKTSTKDPVKSQGTVDMFTITGTMTRPDLSSQDGIMVGVIPAGYTTVTDSKGNFEISVSGDAPAYTGIGYYRDGQTQRVFLEGIEISPLTHQGTLNHTF